MLGIPSSTEQNANGRIVPFGHFVFLEIVEIEIELANLEVFELFGLQFNQNMTFQETMIENQINKIMLIVYRYPPLPRLETEPFPKFQQKVLQMV